MAVAPNDRNQPPLVPQPPCCRIVATFGHFADRLSQPAQERSACADPPRRFKKNDCLGSFEPKVECLEVVAVCNPGGACEQAALLLAPLAL